MKPHKTYLIMGYGVSGRDAAHVLAHRKIPFTVMEENIDRISEAEMMWLKTESQGILTPEQAENALKDGQIDSVIISPGIAKTHPVICAALQYEIPVLSELSFAAAMLSGKKIGVTGTNGKTTTVHILYDIFNRQQCTVIKAGNIGNSVSGEVLKEVRSDMYILEISSYQLEFADTLELDGAVITNIAHDHLARYANFDEYVHTKLSIVRHVRKNGFVVIPYSVWKTYNPNIPKDIHCFIIGNKTESTGPAAFDENGVWLNKNNEWKCVLDTADMKILGMHSCSNAALALTAAICMQFKIDTALQTIREFKGLSHRIEWVASYNGIEFYNDSKATNPDATERALECFTDKSVVLILGGQDKNCSLEILKKRIKHSVKQLVLIGESQPYYKHYFQDVAPIACADNLGDAVHTAYKCAEKGDVVLLSPACASFDMFDNFEERGNVFKRNVQQLIDKKVKT